LRIWAKKPLKSDKIATQKATTVALNLVFLRR